MHRSLKGVTQNIVYFHSIDVKIEEPNHPPSPPSLKLYRGQQLAVTALLTPPSELLTVTLLVKAQQLTIVTLSHNSHQSCVITKCCAGLQTLHCSTQLHMHDSTVSSTRCVIMLYLHTVTPGPHSLSLSGSSSSPVSSAPTLVSPHHHNISSYISVLPFLLIAGLSHECDPCILQWPHDDD